jgi:ubiquinol-cytochrome c reductase iron-sulfur subunit
MSDTPVDTSKRTWLIASGCAGAAGAAFTAVPFVSSFQPSERPRPPGAPVEVDISALKPGEKITVEWRGKPVWILQAHARAAGRPCRRSTAKWPTRIRAQGLSHPRVRQERIPLDQARGLVGVGICTHLGCSPRPAAARPAALAARQLGGRLPVPLPRLHVRPGRPRVQEQAGARQPGCRRTCTCPTPAADRRRQEHEGLRRDTHG